MATTLNDDEIKIKPAIPSLKCEIMLNNALAYLAKAVVEASPNNE